MQPGQQPRLGRSGWRRHHPLYPPRQLPPHPQLPTRRRIRWLPVVLIAAAVIVAAFVVVLSPHGHRTPYVSSPYAPQPQRSAEVVGNPDGPLSQQAIDDIARFNSYEVLPKFADRYNITDHFEETRQLMDAAKKYGNDLKVFDYFSASYWFDANDKGWGRYASGFQQAWLLRDSTGATIPFLGAGGAASGSNDQKGYLIDLSNPNYRAWAVATIVDWMRAAPYAGISFDSATPMVGDEPSHAIADGTTTYNALLCGATLAASRTDCPRVLAWNQGLIDLLAQASSALHAMGDEVRYNGIAPSQLRGASRNVGLLRYTDMASDEGFCMAVSVNDPTRVVFNSFVNDAALMREIAGAHKKVTEITNTYGSDARNAYSDYCLAGFLIGWQPGSSYFTFHAGYGDPPGGNYPAVPEQDLNLGDPLTVGYQVSGAALTRRFQNGFVAVNPTDSSVMVTIPAAVVSFSHGSAGPRYAAGQNVTLPPRGAILSLTQSYLFGSAGHIS
jgi:Hypothetical glycosyl hydrolase family 15